MCSGGVSESSRICLQSLKSRLCGGDRLLPLLAFVERRQGQVPLFIDVRPWAGHRGMTVGINESRFATSRGWICVRESGVQRFSQNR